MTVVHNEAVPEECYTGRHITARGFGMETSECRTAVIDLKLKGRQLELEVLVAPPGFLVITALLGRDLPFLRKLLDEPPQDVLPVLTRAQ